MIPDTTPTIVSGHEAGKGGGVFARLGELCRRHHKAIVTLFALCWCLLYFWQPFDYNQRFFRIPLLLLLVPVLAAGPAREFFRYLRRSPLFWSVMLLAGAGVLAAAFSPFPELRSYRHIVFGWVVMCLAGAALHISLPQRGLRLLLLALSSGLLLSAVCAFVGDAFGLLDEPIRLADQRLFFFTGYPATLGLLSGFCLIGVFQCRQSGRYLLSRNGDLLLMLGLLLLLLLSQSRMSLLFALGAMALLTVWNAANPLRTLGILCLTASCLMSGAVLLGEYTSLGKSAAYKRMTLLITDPMKDTSVVGRLGLWEVGWGVFLERPLTGSGMRMFGPMREKYLERHGQQLQDKYDFVEEGGPHAHNLALGVLSEMGLAGFLPLALLAGCLLAGARRTPRGSDKQCLLALFFYFACHGAVDYMLNKVVYSDLLFGCIGLFLGMLFLEKSEDIPLTE